MAFLPLNIEDFSGGLTDFPVGAPPNELMAAKNVRITVDKKASVRPGSLREGTTDLYAKLPWGVAGLLPNLSNSGLPYKLSNSLEATGANRRGRLYSHNGTTHAEVTGPTGNALFTNAHAISADPRFIASSWNGHHYLTSASLLQKPQKMYLDNSGVLQMRTAGLPPPAQVTLTFSLAAAANSRAYAIGLKYTYTSAGRTFIDRGPLLRLTSTGAGQIYTGAEPTGGAPNVVGNFPVLSNGVTDNYDTAATQVELYRTTNNGKIYYLVGAVTNGTTSLSDGITDTALLLLPQHYSTSGQPDFDPPPTAKFVHVTERGIGIYGCIQDPVSGSLKNRFVQSIPGAPDKVPGSFNADVDEELTGISSYRGIPLFFTTKRVYRGEGFFTPSGSGSLVPRKIADSVGCISHGSIVQTPEGVFFAGENGFYWTDGFSVTPVSDKIRLTYARVYAGAAGLSISSAYDESEKQAYWTFQDTNNSDGLFVLHTRFGVTQGGCFTILGGETANSSTQTGANPVSLPATINQNFRAKCLLATKDSGGSPTIYRGDDRGYAFSFSTSAKTDPRVDTTSDMSLWGTTAISYDVRLVALNFGTNFVRKWTPKAILTLKNRGNLSLKVSSDRNLEGRPKECRELRKRSEYSWGDPGVTWGDPVIYSSEVAMYEEIRMMPVPGVRCSYRSLWFQNSFTVINDSDALGPGSLDATAKTLTLLTVTSQWPSDILDLYISFPDAQGAYSRFFLITARTSTVLTFQDPSNLLSTLASTRWQLMGVAKGHVMELQSVVLPYMVLDSTQGVYRPGEEGGNS